MVDWELLRSPGYVDLLDPGLLVPHYLIHCYLYYEMSVPVIEDHQFDDLGKRLKDEWDDVEHHHKHLIDPDGLSSGGSYIKHPLRVAQAAQTLLRSRPGQAETLIPALKSSEEEDLGDLF
jgi:hypothetical protein